MCSLQNDFSVLTSPINREGCAKASAALIMHVAREQVSLSLSLARSCSLSSPRAPLPPRSLSSCAWRRSRCAQMSLLDLLSPRTQTQALNPKQVTRLDLSPAPSSAEDGPGGRGGAYPDRRRKDAIRRDSVSGSDSDSGEEGGRGAGSFKPGKGGGGDAVLPLWYA